MSLEIWEYHNYAVVNKWRDSDAPIPSVLTIPSTYNGKPITQIRHGAFAGRKELERVYIPNSLQVIGDRAFEECSNLLTFTPNSGSYHSAIPESVNEIGERAFANTKLSGGILTILGKYLTIGDEAFQNAQFARVVVGSESLKLGKRTFQSCNLELVIGNPSISVTEECFSYCSKLKIMSLPISSVGDRGFYACTKLEVLKPVGKKPARIGTDAFWGCTALEIPESWNEKGGKKRVKKKPEDTIVLPKLPACFFETVEDPEDNMTDEEREYAILEEAFHEGEEPLGPLLKLEIKTDAPEPLNIPSRLKGRFFRLHKKNFQVSAPTHLAKVDFLYDDTVNLASLLRYLAEQGTPLYISGRRKGKFFEVEDIQPIAVTGPFVSKDFFRELIRRARISNFQEDAIEQKTPQYHMSTAEEFEAFLNSIGRSVLPAWAYERAKFELETLKSTRGDEAKHAKLALEVLLGVRWDEQKNIIIPFLEEIQRTFDDNFSGMQEVKRVFYELSAHILHTGKLPKENILLVGPAGTGKTAVVNFFTDVILKTIPSVQLDFNGMGKDCDAVTGSSRIYGNARLGSIAQGYYTHKTSTIVLRISELDKALSTGGLGSDVLLGILDRQSYKENFMECPIPTKNLLCIATANSLEGMSAPLRSRFRIVHVPGYTNEEKLHIWRNHALPKVMKEREISPEELCFTEEAEKILIRDYAIQAGCRDLEEDFARRFVSKYCYDITMDYNAKGRTYTAEDVRALLGPSRVLTRPFDVHPGLVRFAYIVDEKPYMSLLEVSVREGTGKMEFLGMCPVLQKQYCRVACRAVQATTTFELDKKYDITVFFPKPIIETAENILGLPMYVAICSALLKTPINKNSLFYAGGVDLWGNLYLDSPSLATELLNAMEAEGIKTVFGASSTTTRFDLTKHKNTPIILESASGEAMVRMAMASN